jgi:hypothetical protein
MSSDHLRKIDLDHSVLSEEIAFINISMMMARPTSSETVQMSACVYVARNSLTLLSMAKSNTAILFCHAPFRALDI